VTRRPAAAPVPRVPDRAPVPRVPDRKAQLVDVAADLFGRDGYHRVGVQDIAAAAGLTGPAVYRHFRSKQEILAHVLLSGLDALAAAVDGALQRHTGAPPADRLAALTAATARLSVERRQITALWRWQRRHLAPEDQAAVLRRTGEVMDTWVGELLLARPELDRADGELLCWAGLSVFGSVAVHHASLPRARFAPLLAGIADGVLASPVVPAASAEPAADPPAANGPATPGPPASGLPASGLPASGLPAAQSDDGGPPAGSPPPGNGRAGSGPAAPGARREAVLAAATQLFRERGYHAVSMEDIGAAVGIAGPSVYRHFAAKADLLYAACVRMADRLAEQADAARSAGAAPADALARLVRSYVGTALAHRDLLAVYAAEAASLPEQDRAALRRPQRAYVQRWVDAVRATPGAPPEPEARIAVHAGLTVANDLVRTHRLMHRPRFAEEVAALVLAALPGATGGQRVSRSGAARRSGGRV
jgi:AcrR family transcriptional regulator